MDGGRVMESSVAGFHGSTLAVGDALLVKLEFAWASVLAPTHMNEAGSSTSATPPYQSCVLVAVFPFAEICLSSVVFLFLWSKQDRDVLRFLHTAVLVSSGRTLRQPRKTSFVNTQRGKASVCFAIALDLQRSMLVVATYPGSALVWLLHRSNLVYSPRIDTEFAAKLQQLLSQCAMCSLLIISRLSRSASINAPWERQNQLEKFLSAAATLRYMSHVYHWGSPSAWNWEVLRATFSRLTEPKVVQSKFRTIGPLDHASYAVCTTCATCATCAWGPLHAAPTKYQVANVCLADSLFFDSQQRSGSKRCCSSVVSMLACDRREY